MRLCIPFATAALTLSCGPLMAAGSDELKTLETESARVDSYAVGHSSTVESRISGTFTIFAGSPDNADALTSGLREGSPIKLTSTAPDGTPVVTRFTPATGPMGYGNVRISLALAQQQLAGLGITDPTPRQLAASLNGGQITYVGSNGLTTTTLRGVLELRAAGQGWGQIAQAYGTKLGPVISGLKTTHAPTTVGITAATSGSTTVSHPTAATTHSTAGSVSSGHAYGQGIVTAYGVGANGTLPAEQGAGHGYGAGGVKTSAPISSAAGSTASAAGISSAHGAANAHGQSQAHSHGKN